MQSETHGQTVGNVTGSGAAVALAAMPPRTCETCRRQLTGKRAAPLAADGVILAFSSSLECGPSIGAAVPFDARATVEHAGTVDAIAFVRGCRPLLSLEALDTLTGQASSALACAAVIELDQLAAVTTGQVAEGGALHVLGASMRPICGGRRAGRGAARMLFGAGGAPPCVPCALGVAVAVYGAGYVDLVRAAVLSWAWSADASILLGRCRRCSRSLAGQP